MARRRATSPARSRRVRRRAQRPWRPRACGRLAVPSPSLPELIAPVLRRWNSCPSLLRRRHDAAACADPKMGQLPSAIGGRCCSPLPRPASPRPPTRWRPALPRAAACRRISRRRPSGTSGPPAPGSHPRSSASGGWRTKAAASRRISTRRAGSIWRRPRRVTPTRCTTSACFTPRASTASPLQGGGAVVPQSAALSVDPAASTISPFSMRGIGVRRNPGRGLSIVLARREAATRRRQEARRDRRGARRADARRRAQAARRLDRREAAGGGRHGAGAARRLGSGRGRGPDETEAAPPCARGIERHADLSFRRRQKCFALMARRCRALAHVPTKWAPGRR